MTTVISGKYEILNRLGQGGMGVVYKVRHTALDTVRALKELSRELMDNQDMVQRFYREARVMAQLRHPNIVRVLDVDRDDTLPCHYFVMEYIHGQTLRQHLQDRGPLPLLEVLEIGRQVAQALSYAHHHNPPVIHRDIKPSNIMIEDGSRRAVVMDFGIAKELNREELTKSGIILGTLKYSAPEQFRRESIDGGADVYSLGMVLYEAYAGKPFFADFEEYEVIVRLLSEAEEHEAHFARSTPPEFAALVTKAIAKSRARRYRHIDEFLQDLEACWKALDNTGTIVTSLQSLSSPLPGTKPPPSLSQIDEEIRKLETERQRQLSLVAQTQARESREYAIQDGAGRWATARFQQGLEREESGHALLRDQEFGRAQQAYQEAVSLFTHAGEEAKAVALLQQAEQTRKDMETAKVEAERYGARERARTFYGRALALQAKADELWKQKLYEQASQYYVEAHGIFEDARELAYRLGLKAGAETAREAMNAARVLATQEGVESVAVEVFQEAAQTQQQADTALSSEEFTQAREFYDIARQAYESAREQTRKLKAEQEAVRQRLRQQALIARQHMETSRATAESKGAALYYAAELAQTRQLVAQGRECEEGGKFEDAKLLYEQATEQFVRIGQETDRQVRAAYERQRQQALEAKKQAEKAQQVAIAEAVAKHFRDLDEKAHEAKRQGEEAEAAQQWKAAEEAFARAAELFGHTVRQYADKIRQETLAMRMDAEQHGAKEKATALYQQGLTLETQANDHWERAAYPQARQGYAEACQIFADARRHVHKQLVKEQAQAARAQTTIEREAARREEAEEFVPSLFHEALEEERRADEALHQENYVQALELYAVAEQKYQVVRHQVSIERRHRQALSFLQQTKEACFKAEAAGATLHSQTYQQAVDAQKRGDTHLAVGEYDSAILEYEQSYAGYERALREEEQAQQQRAENARQQLQAVKERVMTLDQQFLSRCTEASAWETQAEEAYNARQYKEATEEWERARRAYEQVEAEAAYEQLRQETLLSRQTATAAREQVLALAFWAPEQWAAVQASEQEAENAWQTQNYKQALNLYEQVCRECEQLRQEAEEAQRRHPALEAQQQVEQQQQLVEEAEAQQFAGELYQQALDVKQAGEHKLVAKQWEEASAQLAQAQELFVQVRYEVRLHKVKMGAEAARTLAVAAQMEAAGENSSVLFPGRYDDAAERLREADLAFTRAEFGAARVKFDQSTMLFTQIYRDAIRYQQRGQAEQSRLRVLQLQEQTSLPPGRQGRRVNRLLSEADRLFQHQQYTEAYQRYEKAAALFSAPSQKFTLLTAGFPDFFFSRRTLFVGVLLFAAALGFYIFTRPAKLEERENPQGTSQTHPAEFPASIPSAQTPATDFLSQQEKHPHREEDFHDTLSLRGIQTQDGLETDLPFTSTDQRATLDRLEKDFFPEQAEDLVRQSAQATGGTAPLFSDPTSSTSLQMRPDTDWQREAHQHTILSSTESKFFATVEEPTLPLQGDIPSLQTPTSPLKQLPQMHLYTADGEIQVQVPEKDATEAFLDGQKIQVLSGGVIRQKLVQLSPGTNTHRLVFVRPSGEGQEIPLTITYYPQWEIRRFQGVSSEVYFVAVSPDGRTLLSCNREKTLSLWNFNSGQKLRMLVGHDDWVTGVAFAPDGQTAISGSDDKTVKLWNVVTGKEMRTFNGHRGVVTSVAFAPDGKTVLSGSSDWSMKLWDVKTGQETRTLTGHAGWVWAVAISPDGKTALSGSEDKTIKFWDLSTGQELRTFSGHRSGVLSVAFSPDGKRMVSASGDRTIKLWDVATGQTLRTLTGHKERIHTVAFSPDGKRIVSASRDKTVKLWDVATGQEIRTFVGHTAAVAGVAFLPDGQMLISGGRDKTLRVWWAGLELAS